MSASVEQNARHHQVLAALGEVLHCERKRLGLSQESVAYAAGISIATYVTLERGFSTSGALANPTLETLVRVMEILPVGPSILLKVRGGKATPRQAVA